MSFNRSRMFSQALMGFALLGASSSALAQSVTTDSFSYTRGETLMATWSDLDDVGAFSYVALALSDASDTSHFDFFNMGSADSGSQLFGHLPAGCGLEMRVYANTTSFEVLYRSPAFDVDCDPAGYGTVIASSMEEYFSSDDPVFSWSDGPGYYYDWIGVAVAGASDSDYISWGYSSEDFSGPYDGSMAYSDLSFKGIEVLPPGNYEVRYHVNDSFEVAARADFRVVIDPDLLASASVTTDAEFYTPRQAVEVSWDGAPGNPLDWTGLGLKRLPSIELSSYIDIYGASIWQYTDGVSAGSHTYTNIKELGQYAARGFVNNTYEPFANQAEFTVIFGEGGDPVEDAIVSTEKDIYYKGEPIAVRFEGAVGDADDLLLIAHADEDPDVPGAVEDWVYFDQAVDPTTLTSLEGLSTGEWTFYPFLAPGDYVARGMHADSFTPMGSSEVFTVIADPEQAPRVYTRPTCVEPSTTEITIGYENVSTPPNGAWIGLWPEGSDAYDFSLSWVYVPNGTPAAEGFLCFSGSLVDEADPELGCVEGTLPEGRYELRVMNKQRRIGYVSYLDVSDDCPSATIETRLPFYQIGDDIDVEWSGMEANAEYMVGILPEGDTEAVVSAFTDGAESGSMDFLAVSGGMHTAIGFHQWNDDVVAESDPFIVCPSGEVPDCDWVCRSEEEIMPFECWPSDPVDSGDSGEGGSDYDSGDSAYVPGDSGDTTGDSGPLDVDSAEVGDSGPLDVDSAEVGDSGPLDMDSAEPLDSGPWDMDSGMTTTTTPFDTGTTTTTPTTTTTTPTTPTTSDDSGFEATDSGEEDTSSVDVDSAGGGSADSASVEADSGDGTSGGDSSVDFDSGAASGGEDSGL